MEYINRAVEPEIVKRLHSGKINVVLGPRQSGKTTMVRHLVDECHLDALWLNADMLDVRELLTNMSPEKWRQLIAGHNAVVVDEAQRVEDIGLALKILIDSFGEMPIIVTGSSAFNLRTRLDEPLTGRKFEWTLLPPSFAELARRNLLSEKRLVESRLVHGSYPGVLADAEDRDRLVCSLASSYLYKDVLALDGIAKASVLDKLVRALSFQIGQEVSYQELAGLVGVDRKTVERYVDILKKCFVVFELPAFARNQRNEIRKSRKVYFYDLGIRNAVIGNLLPLSSRPQEEIGHLWENYLIAERLKLNVNRPAPARMFFWRTRTQQEVDYIEEGPSGIRAWEMKWNPKPAEKGKLPKAFIEAYPEAQAGFVTPANLQDFLLNC